MKITIDGDPKEIAALVLELQERQTDASSDELAIQIIRRLQERQDQVLQAL